MAVHILHVVESFAAGTLRIVCEMANRQAADGHCVSLAYSLRDETPKEWRALLHAGVETHHLPMRRALAPVADFKSLLALSRLVGRLHPDIVHLHSSKAGALGRIVSLWRRDARWFFSPHGLSFLQSNTAGRVHPLYLMLERALAKLPTAIVACSPSEGQLIERYLGRKALVVPSGISLDAIRPRRGGTNARTITVATAGRISQARNPELFACVARRLAGTDLRFVWLGGGETAEEAELRAAGVEVTGWLPHARLMELLGSVDIYLQPSRWEGLPVAVMEAMATGLPVVATDIVGNRDLVQHGRTGWLARSEDQLVDGVRHLGRDPALRSRWGGAAREHVRTSHSSHSMMRHLYRAYGLEGGPGGIRDISPMDAARRRPYIEFTRPPWSQGAPVRRARSSDPTREEMP